MIVQNAYCIFIYPIIIFLIDQYSAVQSNRKYNFEMPCTLPFSNFKFLSINNSTIVPGLLVL